MRTTLLAMTVAAQFISIGCVPTSSAVQDVRRRIVVLPMGKLPIPEARSQTRPIVLRPFHGSCEFTRSLPMATESRTRTPLHTDTSSENPCRQLHESVVGWLHGAKFPVWIDTLPTLRPGDRQPIDPGSPGARDDYIVVDVQVTHLDTGIVGASQRPRKPSTLRATITFQSARGAVIETRSVAIVVQVTGTFDRPLQVLGNRLAHTLSERFNADFDLSTPWGS